VTKRTPHSDGDDERDENPEANDSASSSAEHAKARELEMEESGEENAA
jgi:hypothetical protein